MANYVSVDLGYGYVKAISSSTGKRIVFPSLVGIGHERTVSSNIDGIHKQADDLNNIHILYDNKGEWFVGELAQQESTSVSRIFERERFEHDYTHILLNVAIQLVTEGSSEPVYLSTGLPLDFYKSQAKDFQRSIVGVQPKIEWKSGPLKGLKMQTVIEKALVFPQAVSAVYAALVNHDGKVIYPQYMKEGRLIALIDVGFRTTDFVVVEMGQNNAFKPIARLSGTVDAGIVNLYDDIMTHFKTEADGADLQERYINRILRDYEISYRGKIIDFKGTIENSKKAIVASIVDRLKKVWKEEADLFDAIFLAGGGGELIEHYIQPHFNGRLIKIQESQFANAIGYLRLGKAVFESYQQKKTQ